MKIVLKFSTLQLLGLLILIFSVFRLEVIAQTSVEAEINDCGNDLQKVFGSNVFVQNLGENINTKFDEYNPVVSSDYSFMLFTARRDSTTGEKIYAEDGDFYEDIMISERVKGRFRNASILNSESQIFPSQINTSKHEAPVFLSPDGNTFIIFKGDKLWYSEKTENGYSLPVLFDNNINFGKYQRHASITEDGNKIYFSSEVNDQNNQRFHFDIFESTKDEAGNWSNPKPISDTLNTRYNEDSPEISKDGKTLFFSSDKPDGFGGYDIYMSTLQNGVWTAAKNVCAPINSAANDIFFKISDDGSNAYFSSNRLGGFGGLDIYKVLIDQPSFKNCEPYTKASMAKGLIMAGRDTICIDQSVSIDGSSAEMNGNRPNSWYWKNGDYVVSKNKTYEPDFTIPGTYEISMQIGKIDESNFKIESQCATKQIVVLDKTSYDQFVDQKAGVSNMKALVGQDEILLSLDGGLGANPYDLMPEVENTYVNTPLDIYVLANDQHPLGSDLKLVEVQNPNYGLSKIVDADQGIAYYKPQRGFVGVDKFFYYAEDDQGQRSKSFVAVQVLDEISYMKNQTVNNDFAITPRDSSTLINVLENDVHPYGLMQSITSVNTPKYGKAEITDANVGVVKYTPKSGFSGNDVFLYTVSDQYGASSTASVLIEVGNSISKKLVAVSDFKYTVNDKPVAFSVIMNDKSSINSPLLLAGVNQPSHGAVKILDPIQGSLLYRPRQGYTGTDGFSYTVSDAEGNQQIVPVTVVVAPTQKMLAINAEPDEEKTIAGQEVMLSLLDNDSQKNAGKLMIASVDVPEHGTIKVTDSLQGLVTYKPNDGFTGFEYFSYTIIDENGNRARSMVEVEVIGDGEMMLALTDDRTETQLNEPIEMSLFANDKLASGQKLTLTSIQQPEHGEVSILDKERGIIRYVPDFGYGGKDFFTYTALDAEGNSATAKGMINIVEPILMANVDTSNLPSLDLKPIYFDFDRSFVRSDAKTIMDENIRILKENPDLIIKVLSHCDARGKRSYNIDLSERRAKATVRYMVERGISKERIIAVVGLGETQISNDCGDGVWCPPTDHQKNRRSDLVVVGKTGK